MLWIFIIVISALEIAGYHRTEDYDRSIGIPMAIKIKEYEDKIIEVESANEGLGQRVSRGWRSNHELYPFLAGLLMQAGEDIYSYCGGTLITTNQVATAAHCVYRKKKYNHFIRVVLGTPYLYYGGVRTDATEYVVHPKWINEPNENYVDIAIIALEIKVSLSKNIQPVRFPTDYVNQSFTGYSAFVTGYGVIDDPRYTQHVDSIYAEYDANQAAEVKVISNSECKLNDSAAMCTSGEGGVGVCFGDSGSPLVVFICPFGYVWIGIVRGIEVKHCQLSYPSQYTRVTEVLDFINDNLYLIHWETYDPEN